MTFCKRHSSWFCPCVASHLYDTAEADAYENGKPTASPEPKTESYEEEQLGLLSWDGAPA